MKDLASVLESYFVPIEDNELRLEDGKNTVSFFGKTWVPNFCNYDGMDPALCLKMFKRFQKISAGLSKLMEKKFCSEANRVNVDPSYSGIPSGSIKKYGDIKGLTLEAVLFLERDGIKMLAIAGGYDIDDEHGWSLAFKDGVKPSKTVGEGQHAYQGLYGAKDF